MVQITENLALFGDYSLKTNISMCHPKLIYPKNVSLKDNILLLFVTTFKLFDEYVVNIGGKKMGRRTEVSR